MNDPRTQLTLLRSQGLTWPEVAERTGLSVTRAQNIVYGRVKSAAVQRADAGRSRNQHIPLLVGMVRDWYMRQGKRTRNLSACIDNVISQAMTEHGIVVPKATLQRHVYDACKREAWEILWAANKNQSVHQSRLPKLIHDYWNNVGYNDYWVIDGRKSDLWVIDDATGRQFMPQGFYVMELRTGRYLHVSHSDSAFNAKQVMLILIETAITHGVPNLGILCDNGAEQIGQDNVLAMEAFWPWEIIELYRTGSGVKGFHDIYPGALSPIVTSLPRIPTEFGKARLERSFGFLQSRLDAFIGGHGYQGGSRFDVVHTTLARTPRVDRTWIRFSDYQRFMHWFLTSNESLDGLLPYNMIERPYMLRGMTQECGLVPTVSNAIDYCLHGYQRTEIPPDNYYRLLYYAVPRFKDKAVRRIHQVEFQHNKRSYAYYSTQIPYNLVGQHVDVLPDPHDDTQAAIFYKGEMIAIARDINRANISLGEKKELLSRIRNHAVASVRADAKQFVQPVLNVPDVEPGKALKAVSLQTDGLTTGESMYEVLADSDPLADPSLSEATAEILSRIHQHL